jgi:preprotein translocase subunit SecA
MFNFLRQFFGRQNFEPFVKKINALEPVFEKLTDEDLKNKSEELKERAQKEGLDELLVETFALVREAAKRTLNQRLFDVQLIGGIVLHQGKIAEMKTGEGKTLAAVAPAYLNALSGKGVHIVTVNDYLATRDAVWMGQIYYALGLSVGCLTHESAYLYDPAYTQEIQNSKFKIQNDNLEGKIDEKEKERDILGSFKIVHEFLRPVPRKEAYQCDILYGTNHEFGFDYLRDNLVYDLNQQVQRNFYYAIIDEVDSVLIDEARTPLIIAAPDTESSEYYKIFTRVAGRLSENEDYLVDEKLKTVNIAEGGIDKVEKILNIKNLYGPENFRLVHYLEESLKAKALFHKDKQYVVKDGEIIIVDEFTGRLMYGRRYSAGLHQAIEAKEGVEVKQESKTFAQITIQNYFRMYEKIAGMTGTAQTSAEEFHKVYNLDVISVPTNKPMVRRDFPDLIYKNQETKYRAIVEEVKKSYQEGRPVLVGTASITHNELLSGLLRKAGVPHEVLNAKNHEREGAIIAQAGKPGAVTVATNMAGRGVDIIFGGNPPDASEARKVRELGGLYVIGADRHEARRIDNQLRGRSGRQGDPGSSRFFLSLEDDLLRIFGGERIKALMESFKLPEDAPIESKLVSKAVNEAQKKVEGINFDSRKHLLEYDDVLNKQRTAFYKKRQEILTSKMLNATSDMRQVTSDMNSDMENATSRMEKIINLSHAALNSVLAMLDILWMNHLENLEALRESVGMRAYGQRDPLVEYRRESFILFKEMMANFERWLEENKEKLNATSDMKIATSDMGNATSKMGNATSSLATSRLTFDEKKVGRNDPCPCGSGKKYKRCHGL